VSVCKCVSVCCDPNIENSRAYCQISLVLSLSLSDSSNFRAERNNNLCHKGTGIELCDIREAL